MPVGLWVAEALAVRLSVAVAVRVTEAVAEAVREGPAVTVRLGGRRPSGGRPHLLCLAGSKPMKNAGCGL